MAGLASADLLNALLGAGGVGFVAAAYKWIKDYREGTWRRHDGAVADLEKWRKSADDARRSADDARSWEAAQGHYWYNRASDLERIIRVNLGADHLPPEEPFPVQPTQGVEVTT